MDISGLNSITTSSEMQTWLAQYCLTPIDPVMTGSDLGTILQKIISLSGVTSVNGQTGTISLTSDDIGEGSTNKYFTDARVASYGDTRYAQLSGSYINPSWITSLPWSKITATPTTLSGYGITDSVSASDLALKESLSNKNIANGYAGLNSSGLLPLGLFPDKLLGNVKYKGTYNGVTNIVSSADVALNGQPLPASTDAIMGYYFINTTAFSLSGINYSIGDWIICDGDTGGWNKVDNSDAVTTVFGRNGNIVANVGDYNTSQVTESGNLYYTDARVAVYADARYLKLTGGNLTGPLNGTYATFTQQLNSSYGVFSNRLNAGNLELAGTGLDYGTQGSVSATRISLGSLNTTDNGGRYIFIYTNNIKRWDFGVRNQTEPGNNTGSNFEFNRYNDAGTYIDSPFGINRQTGVATFSQSPIVPNATTSGQAVNLGQLDTKLGLAGGNMTGTLSALNIYTTSAAPTAALVGGAGISGTGATITVTGTNNGGIITLVTGTGINSSGTIFRMTNSGSFSFNNSCVPILQYIGYSVASDPIVRIGGLTQTSWDVYTNGFIQLSPSTTYVWAYSNLGY